MAGMHIPSRNILNSAARQPEFNFGRDGQGRAYQARVNDDHRRANRRASLRCRGDGDIRVSRPHDASGGGGQALARLDGRRAHLTTVSPLRIGRLLFRPNSTRLLCLRVWEDQGQLALMLG